MTDEQIERIYNQGQNAYSNGMSIKMNPYRKDDLKAQIWACGWEGNDVYFWLFGE